MPALCKATVVVKVSHANFPFKLVEPNVELQIRTDYLSISFFLWHAIIQLNLILTPECQVVLTLVVSTLTPGRFSVARCSV